MKPVPRSHFQFLLTVALALLVAGCATRPINPPIAKADPNAGYRLMTRLAQSKDKDNLVILAFSGGGMRAATSSAVAITFRTSA